MYARIFQEYEGMPTYHQSVFSIHCSDSPKAKGRNRGKLHVARMTMVFFQMSLKRVFITI